VHVSLFFAQLQSYVTLLESPAYVGDNDCENGTILDILPSIAERFTNGPSDIVIHNWTLVLNNELLSLSLSVIRCFHLHLFFVIVLDDCGNLTNYFVCLTYFNTVNLSQQNRYWKR